MDVERINADEVAAVVVDAVEKCFHYYMDGRHGVDDKVVDVVAVHHAQLWCTKERV